MLFSQFTIRTTRTTVVTASDPAAGARHTEQGVSETHMRQQSQGVRTGNKKGSNSKEEQSTQKDVQVEASLGVDFKHVEEHLRDDRDLHWLLVSLPNRDNCLSAPPPPPGVRGRPRPVV